MNLSPHFTLAEFIASQTAARMNINNDPPPEAIENLKRTAAGLERVRVLLNANAIHVSSGYRCLALNTAVGSRLTSQHTMGQAVDFTCPTFGTPERVMDVIARSDLAFDQCILEFGQWVHISFRAASNRMQLLVIDAKGTRNYQ